jgi:hypothetical protein
VGSEFAIGPLEQQRQVEALRVLDGVLGGLASEERVDFAGLNIHVYHPDACPLGEGVGRGEREWEEGRGRGRKEREWEEGSGRRGARRGGGRGEGPWVGRRLGAREGGEVGSMAGRRTYVHCVAGFNAIERCSC